MLRSVRQRAHHALATVSVLALVGLPTFDIGDLLSGLLGGGSSGIDQAPSKAEWRRLGSTSSPDRALRRGCHPYRYRYAVHPPEGTDRWLLEVFVKGPRGGHVASAVLISGADRRQGRQTFQLCRSHTTAGRFTIRGRLTLEDWPDEYTGWIGRSHFRLRR